MPVRAATRRDVLAAAFDYAARTPAVAFTLTLIVAISILVLNFNVVVPLVERIAHKISITGYTLAVDERMEPPHPAVQTLRGRIWWQVLDPERADTVIDRADDLIRLRLRDAVQGADATDSDLRSRNLRIKQTLNGSLRDRGVLVTRVELDLAA